MKTQILLLTLSSGFALSASAQIFTDDFTGGYDGTVFAEVNGLGPSFALKNPDAPGGNDALNYYTTVAPTGFEQVFLNYQGTSPASPTNLQNFAVSMDAVNFAGSTGLTAPASSLAQIGLNINYFDSGSVLQGGFNLYNGAYSFGGSGSSDAIFFDGTNFAQPLNFSTGMTLLAEFDASTQTFTFSYATSTLPFTPFSTLNIDGTGTAGGTDFVDNWGMLAGESFDINIYAGSNVLIPNEAAGLGYMNADNFFINVVPEPSAFALLAGFVAVGMACVRRRR